jgi:hypothetical protein
MTPWCRRRPVWPPDLGFPPTSDGRGHSEGHEHAFKQEMTPVGVAVLSLASANPDFRPGRTPCLEHCLKMGWRWRARMNATGLSHHHQQERNTVVGKGHRPPPAPPRPPKPKPPPPVPPRYQLAAAAKSYRRHHRACVQPRSEKPARPRPSRPEPAWSSLSRMQERLRREVAKPGRCRRTRSPSGACSTLPPRFHAPSLPKPKAIVSAWRSLCRHRRRSFFPWRELWQRLEGGRPAARCGIGGRVGFVAGNVAC